MTRALHIVSGKLYGGVETLLVTLARYRDSHSSLEQQFAICFDGRLRDELALSGATVSDLGAVRVRQPLSIWRARNRLRRVIDEQEIDVVICHMAWAHAIFAPVARAAGRSLVFWLHMATDGRHWLERWARMTAPDLAIAPSRFTSQSVAAIFPQVETRVVHYAVAPPADSLKTERSIVRAEMKTPDDAIVIVQACRPEAWKGQGVHLDALAELRELPGWVCWMVGGAQRAHEHEFLESLKRQASRAGIGDRVRFAGQRADVPRILAAADIYCQPNTGLEGLPIVFTEALDAGLPIVTTDIGGFWEIVDESCGIRVPPNDAGAVAAALRSLITDESMRRRLGNAGPAKARAFSDPVAQIRLMGALFDELAQGRSAVAASHGI
ncbi:MAG: glycosyltransferase [Candidatus Binatus sp.]|uniref:glycosyltransferase n=1 Tax=Candidatus Binatus sp. TaxID=2811406 RepID=UPI00272114FA|nr:glycosyltransferase [Candidatus Binatus sp.]MDO8431600.1 glycosyltransferase [Candidatus Binatus sp.]